MSKAMITESTIISETELSPDRYRYFLRENIESFAPEVYCGTFQYWLYLFKGKPLKDAIDDYYMRITPKSMDYRLAEERFSIISEPDKAFIHAFSNEIAELGYDYGGHIGSGYGWGPYMIIYSKIGVKSKQVAARIYIRIDTIVLRLYFSDIDKHRAFIENAPPHIKRAFTDDHGKCNHCENCHRKDGLCKFRKTYTIDSQEYEKCNGVVFEFWQPNTEKLPDYIELLREFYGKKTRTTALLH